MRVPILPVFILLAHLGAAALADPANRDAELFWRNGDKLRGEILPSEQGILNWHSPAFDRPFELDEMQLEKIAFSRASGISPGPSADAPFRITFSNGDRVQGEIISLDSQQMCFRSPSLGHVAVQRHYLNRVERISGGHLRYSGPEDFDQWKPLGKNVEGSDWQVRESGEFASTQWGAELFRDLEIPEKSEIFFVLQFPGQRPNFEIGFTESPEAGPLLECWDDTLVITSGDRFQPVMALPAEGMVGLRVFWDQQTRRIKVCNANGELLSELDEVAFKSPQVHSSSSVRRRSSSSGRDPSRLGFRLLNRTSHLLFSNLQLREWDGVSIPRFDASKPRVELAGSSEVIYDLDNVRLTQESGLRVGDRAISLSEIDQVVFSADRRFQNLAPAGTESVASFFDGSIVSGRCSSLRSGSAAMAPIWQSGGITLNLLDAREWRFPVTDEPPSIPPDRLKTGDVDLGGYLGIGDSTGPEDIFTWTAAGSRNASTLADERDGEIVRGSFPAGNEPVGDARIFLTNDEIISGTLLQITPQQVEFSSPLTGQIAIPSRFVRAVDIEGSGLMTEGFQDKGWTISPESQPPARPEDKGAKSSEGVTLTRDKAILKSGGFGHTNLLVGDRISFDAFWPTDYGVFTVRLFCADFSTTSPSTDILISRGPQADQILIGQVKAAGGFHFSSDRIAVKEKKAKIEILAQHDKVEVSVNGQKSLSLQVEPGRIAGNGIIFQMGGGWRGWSDVPNEIVISNFSMSRSPGFLPRRIIHPLAKQNVLSVPRFLRSDPPTHVLIAGNGDLLRGNLKSAQGDKIRFVSRGSELEFPRSRVSAIVWVRDEEKSTETADSETPTADLEKAFRPTQQLTLNDGTRLFLVSVSGNRDSQTFTGISHIIGRCEIPLQSIYKRSYGPNLKITRPAGTEQFAYTDWRLQPTPDPAIPKGDGSEGNPAIGKPATDFTIPILGGGQFTLSKRKGRVVVLDFWASWCGPCVKAMPEVFQAVDLFNGQPIDFLAVNQAETTSIISKFLEIRKWTDTSVGIDFDLSVSRAYDIKSIPHTVVIGKDGKIEWVHTGYSADLTKKLATAIARALQKQGP